MKKVYNGDLIIKKGEVVNVNYTEITGSVYVYGEFNAEKLETIGSNVSVSGEFNAEKLETIGGSVDVDGEFNAEKLETIGGSVDVSGEFNADKLETIGGYVYVYVYGEFNAEKLETIGGSVYVYGEFNADKLETIGGYVYVSVSGEFNAEKLETIGGSVYVSGEFNADKLETKNNDTAKKTSREHLEKSFCKKGFVFYDNILAKKISKKVLKNIIIHTVILVGSLEKSYIVQDNDLFAHGETIEEAKNDLIYKISDIDTSDYEKYNLESVLSFEECIKMYRAITGACSTGTKYFVERNVNKIKDNYKIKEIIEITKGQYGNEKLSEFFNK